MPIPCARCSTPLPKWELVAGDRAVCTNCLAGNTVRVFPALLARRATAEAVAATEGEAACFDHPGKKAVASCQQCGRFVCQLCAIDFDGVVRCPSCMAGGPVARQVDQNVTTRTLYDSIALTLPLASLIFYPLNIVAAPAALTIAVVKWRQPLSLVRRSRWRLVLAILISLAEIVGWTALFALLIRNITQLPAHR
jgi:hypothetical protein